MLLFVGLGNPGADYAHNRHNIGFMIADAIARTHGLSPWRSRFRALVAEGRIGQEKAILLKPQTFMNNSGRAVGEALRFYKLPSEAVYVFYDEIDLAPGKLRVKRGGGHGGHNGVRDIAAHIDPDFWRVRVGVGHPGHKDAVVGHVLKDFAKADREWVSIMIDSIAAAVPQLAHGDPNGFMNKVAVAMRPADEAKPAAKSGDRPGGSISLPPTGAPTGAPTRAPTGAHRSAPPPLAGAVTGASDKPEGPFKAALARVFGRRSSQ